MRGLAFFVEKIPFQVMNHCFFSWYVSPKNIEETFKASILLIFIFTLVSLISCVLVLTENILHEFILVFSQSLNACELFSRICEDASLTPLYFEGLKNVVIDNFLSFNIK